MNEWNKAQAGYLYDANYDREVVENRTKCADLYYEFNQCKPSDTKKQAEIIKKIIGCIKGDFVITAPFYCDYGSNITIGNNFYTNHNCTMGLRLPLAITYLLLLMLFFQQLVMP